jgi:hypothetical protein
MPLSQIAESIKDRNCDTNIFYFVSSIITLSLFFCQDLQHVGPGIFQYVALYRNDILRLGQGRRILLDKADRPIAEFGVAEAFLPQILLAVEGCVRIADDRGEGLVDELI